MKTSTQSSRAAASSFRPMACISTAAIFALTAFASADKQGSKPAGEGDADKKGDLVRVAAFEKGVVRRALEHKTHSPDRRLFAGYYRDGLDEVISIHDAASGDQIQQIVGHGDEVTEFKFSPDGKLLASRCVNRHREGWALWNVATGKLLMRLPAAPRAARPD